MELKKGNYVKLVIGPIRDANKAIITNLATAASIRYLVKEEASDLDTAAVITKGLATGVTIDDPSQGCVSVVINAADTESLPLEEYYQGLQIEYSSTNIQEINIIENNQAINMLTLTPDVVRKP